MTVVGVRNSIDCRNEAEGGQSRHHTKGAEGAEGLIPSWMLAGHRGVLGTDRQLLKDTRQRKRE